jgi:hypothetical protein
MALPLSEILTWRYLFRARAGNYTEILVNNAGAIPGGNIDAVDEARWPSSTPEPGCVVFTRADIDPIKAARPPL